MTMRDEMIKYLDTYTDYPYETLVGYSDDILTKLCNFYASEFLTYAQMLK